MNQTAIFLALMLPATFFLGLNDVLIRKVLRGGKLSEQFLLAGNYLVSAILFAIALAFVGTPVIQPGFWSALIVTVLLNTFAQWAWYTAFRKEEASLISPLRLLTPPLVIITGFLVLGEKTSFLGAIGILTTILGLWLLVKSESKSQRLNFLSIIKRPGVLLGLWGAVSFAVSFPFDKKIVVTSSALFALTLAFFGVGLINSLIWIFMNFRKEGFTKVKLSEINLPALIAIPLVQFFSAFLSYAALSYSLAAYASSVKRLWSLWAVILSGKFLGEAHIKERLLATLIMLAGILTTVFLG